MPTARLHNLAPVAILLLATSSPAAQTATAPTLVAHSDTQFAHELLRLGQTEIIAAQAGVSAGTPAADLWKAQLILARWDDISKDRAQSITATADYFTALDAYLATQKTTLIDGPWALDHARFILARLAEPTINRMEYWANSPADRAALAPMAESADRLLKRAALSLQSALRDLENRKPFTPADEAAYGRAYSAAGEVEYYTTWTTYFRAMAADPADPQRKNLLATAAADLAKWAVDEPDNGVNYQAYLLRGKVFSEAGDLPKALADFQKAQNDKAPAWVQYQARYQSVVANLHVGDLKTAQSSFAAFRRWIPKDNLEAQLSADMLAYRVAWAAADRIEDPADRKVAHVEALTLLASVIDRDPRFRELVYQQLAAQIPPTAAPADLLPMQQLALAFITSQGQKGDTPDSQTQLRRAVAAALAVHNNSASSKSDRLEATFLIGVCNALLGNLADAARYNVEFVEAAPNDPRAKPVLELALQQIGALRKSAGDAGLAPDLLTIAQRALALSTTTFGDIRWRYTQARTLEEAGKLDQAITIYNQITADDRNYLDARYRLVNIALARLSQLGDHAPQPQRQQAAATLFDACSRFVDLLDHPPAAAPADALERAKAYRADIWMIETATALSPDIRNTDVALDRLARLDSITMQLTTAQKTAIFRYRVLAYQQAGQLDKAYAAVQDYAKAAATGPGTATKEGGGGGGLDAIRSLAISTIDEITRIEPTDRPQAQRLAGYVTQLLDPMIKQAQQENKPDTVFEYHLIQADMLIRSGRPKDAESLATQLITDHPNDLRPALAQARAIFAEAQAGDTKAYPTAQDRFTALLPRFTPGAEGFWECWLRIFQSMEAQGAPDAAPQIKQRLGDLKAVYGTKFGGDTLKPDFDRLAAQYAIP